TGTAPETQRKIATNLAQQYWDARAQFKFGTETCTVDECVQRAMNAKTKAAGLLEEKSAIVAEARQAIATNDAANRPETDAPRSMEELESSLGDRKQTLATAGTAVDTAAEAVKRLREAREQSEKELTDLAGPRGARSESEIAGKSEPAVAGEAPPVDGSSDGMFVNSLGMKFVPVGDVQFSIWLTRCRDFEVFAHETEPGSSGRRDPGFRQGPDHPVVMVNWDEATKFCHWLTAEERRRGLIKSNQSYRLPTDAEWSEAVGLSTEKGGTPETRDMGVPNVYPWGAQWPPPPGAGNYTGGETESEVAIRGYVDGFAWTAPVGSFSANARGLFDMGGNVWEWCRDNWNAAGAQKVLRGGSWFNGDVPLSLLSSCRVSAAPDTRTDYYGFRVVLASDGVP
ncbi:MAG: SUMF1/EgtB/PvdO family nonheme iron enzyme, partial [Chthoniobacteraceae bacterium]